MNNRLIFVAAAMSALLVAATAGAASQTNKPATTKSYRWVDKNGITHYGDSVPPEYAAQGRQELNQQGVPLREYPRQLSPSEAAEAQKVASAEARRKQHDSFLLSTYTKVADIEQLRDERLALIDGQMDIARGSIATSTQRLTSLQNRLLNYRPYSAAATARRVPDQLAGEIVRTLKENRGLQAVLDSREKEKAQLRAEFDGDIARYQELTTLPALR